MLQVSHVDLSYGREKVVQDISFSLNAGELLSIIGPNGSGKSTLLKAILGIKKIDHGMILINGLPPRKAVSQCNIAYLPQQSHVNILLPLTVYDVAAQGFQSKKIGVLSPTEKDAIEEVLLKVKMSDKKSELFMNLSGGQRQRTLLALALATKPSFLCLDEPTNALDIATIEQIYEILSELKKENTGILLISHDISSIVSHSDKIGVLMKTMHYFGSPYFLPETVIHQVFGTHIKIIPDDPNCQECSRSGNYKR
ncbi:MAG: metal ABC transporter ATP-binding protein [Brevinema sp.]